MANRHNLYEAAFEAYLRQERIAYVAVDEQRRAPDGDATLKSVDFLVSARGATRRAAGVSWLVDVKGRLFPSGKSHPQYWRNWSTRDDLESLARWRRRLGVGFDAALVFAYRLVGDRSPMPPEQVFAFRDGAFAFVAIRLDDYLAHAKTLSPRWGTVSMPIAAFRGLARPAGELLAGPAPAARGLLPPATA